MPQTLVAAPVLLERTVPLVDMTRIRQTLTVLPDAHSRVVLILTVAAGDAPLLVTLGLSQR
ncbi:MAG: hypothetical protein AAFP90_10370 [Planctomycetota bacterium]